MDETDQLYDTDADHLHGEVDDLRHEVERFKEEKERVRAIIGRIGGAPSFNVKIYNFIFAILIIGGFGASILAGILHWGGEFQLAMIELAVAAVSVKIVYLMHKQARVNHFEFWILSSLEWRLDQIMKEIKTWRE
jgi:hypothetical protein